MAVAKNVLENLRLELRRGCLTVAVLAQLRQEHFGYSLRESLAQHKLDIDVHTLCIRCCGDWNARGCW